MSVVSHAHNARAELNRSGSVLLRVADLHGADDIMRQLSDLLQTDDGWPAYARMGADQGRRQLSAYFHSVTQRRDPTIALSPHNELSYIPCSPIGVVAFVGLSANYSGGHIVVSQNALARLPPEATPYYRYYLAHKHNLSAPTAVPSMFTHKQYLQLGSLETFFGHHYVEHFLRMFSALLPYPWQQSVSATMKQFSGGSTLSPEDQAHEIEAYYGTVTPKRSRAIKLEHGDLLLLDNRRHTHAVLPSKGNRMNGVGMLLDPHSARLCLYKRAHASSGAPRG